MTRVPAEAVLDLNKWAAQPDTIHATEEEAKEAADADARWLEFEVRIVFVREAESATGDRAFDPPVRARVTDVCAAGTYYCSYVDFVFLDPVDPEAFPPDKNGKQYGWWYSRTHRLASKELR